MSLYIDIAVKIYAERIYDLLPSVHFLDFIEEDVDPSLCLSRDFDDLCVQRLIVPERLITQGFKVNENDVLPVNAAVEQLLTRKLQEGAFAAPPHSCYDFNHRLIHKITDQPHISFTHDHGRSPPEFSIIIAQAAGNINSFFYGRNNVNASNRVLPREKQRLFPRREPEA